MPRRLQPLFSALDELNDRKPFKHIATVLIVASPL